MKRIPMMVVALLVAALALPASAAPEPAHSYELDDEVNTSASFTSDPQVGTNVNFFLDGTATTYECVGTPDAACERTFISIRGLTDEDIANGEIKDAVTIGAEISNYSVPVADFDLLLFAVDADGNIISELGRSGNNPGEAERVDSSVTTTVANPVKYVMAEVVVFASPGSTYDMSIYVN